MAPQRVATTPRCGALDVADLGHIPTGELPESLVSEIRRAALASPAYDGLADDGSADARGTVAFGASTVAKLQHRAHERLGTVLRLEWLRHQARIRAPRLLDHGTVPTGHWWAILDHAPGAPAAEPTPARQRALGAQLRAWHESGPGAGPQLDGDVSGERPGGPGGLRLDDPGGLGVLLGTPREFLGEAYPELAERYAAVCQGMPLVPIHGDVAVCHNTLYAGDELAAVLDSGAVEYGPPMLDLACALAIDLPHGAAIDPLLDGYGRDAVDEAALHTLLPLLALRRLVDIKRVGVARVGARWLVTWLRACAPDLLPLASPLAA
ncbi:MAG: phosphotransferase [Micromonosporaceae bacterium]